MVSLDPFLADTMICTRPSMMKFTARGTMDVEICGIADRKIPLYLNRPLIKVLEDLGINPHVLINLQKRMMIELEHMLNDPIKASLLLSREKIADVCGIPDLITLLYDIDVDAQYDEFIRSVVEFAALCQLREVKYRGRIRVPGGIKLYGVMDETAFLKEGQIYCSWLEDGKQTILSQDKVLITRSPTMHPGDVQLVNAVNPPKGSPLLKLYNCIVFSQFGSRDLPSQLGGGGKSCKFVIGIQVAADMTLDLDGDQFDIIWDRELIPNQQSMHSAADYPKHQPRDIGRQVEPLDIMKFFIEFMENDRVGQISSLHLQLADRVQRGTRSEPCIKLAEMASIAVDYGKSGIPVSVLKKSLASVYTHIIFQVNMDDRPKFDTSSKPDFMAPGPKVDISKATDVSDLLDREYDRKTEEPLDAFQALDQTDRPVKYYQSENVLGKLYRLIDERIFYQNIRKMSKEKSKIHTYILRNALQYVLRKTHAIQYKHHKTVALEIRDIYESHINNTRYEFAFRQNHPLHELEVIACNILGSNTRANRENSRAMRQAVERNLAYVKDLIIKGPVHSDDYGNDVKGEGEELARSIACFKYAMDEQSELEQTDNIHSWKYFAAAICLRQVANTYGRGREVLVTRI
jgi:RNA dependent RNA polymerase